MTVPPVTAQPSQPPLGRIITFYSYKGGTGRSMALANVAWVLALNGYRVLVIDWDLEAPGIHRYFHPFLTDKELVSTEGLVDMFEALAAQAATSSDPLAAAKHVDIFNYVEPLAWPRNTASPLTWKHFGPRAGIDIMPAGRQGPAYSLKFSAFRWIDFYERLSGRHLLEVAKEQMRKVYDYVLIDSRTGVGDTSGICTVEMPDTLVICFTLNEQSIRGASAVAESVRAHRRPPVGASAAKPVQPLQRPVGPTRMFPVPMRVETSEHDKLYAALKFAKTMFSPYLDHLPQDAHGQYWGAVQMTYFPFYAFEEIPAVFADDPDKLQSLATAVKQLTRVISDPPIDRIPLLAEDAETAEKIRKEIVGWYLRPAPQVDPVQLAQDIFDGFDQSGRVAMKRALLRLIGIGPDANPIAKSVAWSELRSDAWITETLAERRLLVIGSDDARTVTYRDPVVVEKWSTLRGWIDEDRQFLVWRAALAGSLRTWKLTGHDENAMLRGKLLDEAVQWMRARGEDLDPDERQYIEACLATAKRIKDVEQQASVLVTNTRARVAQLEQLLGQRAAVASEGDKYMDDILRYVWGEYRAWAMTSRVLKNQITRGGLIVLSLTLLGTALGTLTPLLGMLTPLITGDFKDLAILKVIPWTAALALGIATYLANQLLSESERQGWVKARALAEALKSEAQKYVTAAPPYDVPNAAQLLSQKAAEAQRILPGVLTEQITAEERARNLPEGPWTIADYAEKRVREQIDGYYRPAIVKHRQAVARAKALALGLGVVAVALSAGSSTFELWPAAVLGIVTTAAAAIGAWFQGGHHQQLALSYQAAVVKLELLLAQHRTSSIPGKQLVTEAEAVFQAEHASWLTEWQAPASPGPSQPPPTPPPSVPSPAPAAP